MVFSDDYRDSAYSRSVGTQDVLRFVERWFPIVLCDMEKRSLCLAWMDLITGYGPTPSGIVDFGDVILGEDNEDLSIGAVAELMVGLAPDVYNSAGDWRSAYWSEDPKRRSHVSDLVVALRQALGEQAQAK